VVRCRWVQSGTDGRRVVGIRACRYGRKAVGRKLGEAGRRAVKDGGENRCRYGGLFILAKRLMRLVGWKAESE